MPKRRLPPKNYIWTPDLAYVVGLLVTDGNLSSNNCSTVLVSKDREMLENFKSCLGIQNKISTHISGTQKHHFRVQYGNVQFYDWLIKIGLSQAKSYTIGAIAIPDEFFRDYFRGCIDGDGNIQTYSDTYNSYKGRRYKTQRLFIRIVSASEKHIFWLQGKIKSVAGVEGFIIRKPPPNDNCVPIWELKFAKKKSLRLIEWMYYSPNVPCLQRKRNIVERAVKIISSQKRRSYSLIK